jgi:hypothetical protein
VQNSLAQKTFLENQGLRDNSDQKIKVIEDTDTGEDNLNVIQSQINFVPQILRLLTNGILQI